MRLWFWGTSLVLVVVKEWLEPWNAETLMELSLKWEVDSMMSWGENLLKSEQKSLTSTKSSTKTQENHGSPHSWEFLNKKSDINIFNIINLVQLDT